MNQLQPIEFIPWYADGQFADHTFDVGGIVYGVDGVFTVELTYSTEATSADRFQLAFQAPLAIRITQEGSLMDYWRNGFVVRDHNIFVAENSQFLSWLEHSSSGVHEVGHVKHFAIFTDDVCVEVLSLDAPKIGRHASQ